MFSAIVFEENLEAKYSCTRVEKSLMWSLSGAYVEHMWGEFMRREPIWSLCGESLCGADAKFVLLFLLDRWADFINKCTRTSNTDWNLDSKNAEVEQLTDVVESLEWKFVEMNLLRNFKSNLVVFEAILENLIVWWIVRVKNGTFQFDTYRPW